MKFIIAQIFILISANLFWTAAVAQSTDVKKANHRRPAAAAQKTSSQGQWAVVKTDNAIVYEQTDFDSAVLMYLPAGQKIRISKTIFGSYFKFYKVKVSESKIGYITSIDVQVQNENDAKSAVRPGGRPGTKSAAHAKGALGRAKLANQYPPVRPFMQTKYLGAFVGMLNYKENIPGVNASENLLVYGFKLTGPKTIIDLPTDLNFTLHYGAPTYYQSFSNIRPTGYVMIADLLLLFPFLEKKQSAFHFGVGPLLDYSSFQFGSASGIANSTDLSLGLAVALGFGAKLGLNWAVRGEYKIMWERANYSLYQLALQNRF